MKPLSRRRFCVSTALTPLFIGPLTSVSAQKGTPLKTNADLPAQTLHAIGVRMLREGRTYEKAAIVFGLAGEKEPENPAHQMGLGCAHAARAASLAYAWFFTQMVAQARGGYADELKAWEAGRVDFEQQKAESPAEYGHTNYDDTKPEMVSSHLFVTKDDNAPFTLTNEEAVLQITSRVQKARQAWEKGVAFCKTPEVKSEACYTQAWGLHLLRTYFTTVPDLSYGLADRPPPEPLPFSPTNAEVVNAGAEATRLAPDNARYAQAMGDFWWDTDKEKALTWYEKSIALAPKNPNLLYFLYQDSVEKERAAYKYTGEAAGNAEANPAPFAVSLNYLHQAQARDRANAWPLYEEAALLFRLAPYSLAGPSAAEDATPAQKQAALAAVQNKAARTRGKQAIDLVARGNTASRCTVPIYAESVPRLLEAVWNANITYVQTRPFFTSFSRLRELARSTMGYAQVMVRENNEGEAARANRACIGMGFLIRGDWSLEDTIRGGKTIMERLVGIAICSIGYKGLMQTYQNVSDKAGAEAARKESDTFKARYDAYCKAINAKQQKEDSIYSVY